MVVRSEKLVRLTVKAAFQIATFRASDFTDSLPNAHYPKELSPAYGDSWRSPIK
jgi:hypothetical protein